MSSVEPRFPRLGLIRERAEAASHLLEALAELGAHPVLVGAAAEVPAEAIVAAGVEVLVVGLDSEIDADLIDSLGAVRVVFDDLEASAGLAGWDRSRWIRHLRAKLLGIVEAGPPRPPGSEPIPHRTGSELAQASRVAAPADARTLETGSDEAASAGDSPSATSSFGDSVPTSESAGPHAMDPADQEAAAFSEAPVFYGEAVSESDALTVEAAAGWALETVEAVDAASELGVEEVNAPPEWQLIDDLPSEPSSSGEAVLGLDELLDALRRDEGGDGESLPGDLAGSADAPVEPGLSAPPRTFDFSSLSLEPLEHERPITGRAQFIVEDAPLASLLRESESQSVSAPETAPAAAAAAWLFAAGDADPTKVDEFIDSLPADLDALFLLVRPAAAPWMGATLHPPGSNRLPMVLGEDVMAPIGGRVVVISPGERVGFNRAGQLTVQPGDPSSPEALADWMSLRALANRYGRDAGLIVFGPLRDELLEGALELARAGGQVWFEASVIDKTNPLIEAARAAGVAMRTGSAIELAKALAARLRGSKA